jgi:hypothetical protein
MSQHLRFGGCFGSSTSNVAVDLPDEERLQAKLKKSNVFPEFGKSDQENW